MKKIFKTISFFIILLLISLNSVYAVNINMNLNNDVNFSVTTEPENTPIDSTNSNTTINNELQNSNSIGKISTSQIREEFTLTVSDIINIILIAVGVVLIFLAIAIIIKIK